ncbi:IclR family transcriptional regulator C-terminal domain-containing protein [Streptomyces sp. NPDC000927]|uniref:IclR family transcriptional regulator C-terminal domain-containing protein n=1 Tax=unclassified Streptomyces TaxID=2593676 RepID=UPI003316D13C
MFRLSARPTGAYRPCSDGARAAGPAPVGRRWSAAFLEEVPSGLSWVGRSYPLYCDDAGKALLWDSGREELEMVFAGTGFVAFGPAAPADVAEFEARLITARQRGYAVVDGESEPGVFAVAAPVRAACGNLCSRRRPANVRTAGRGSRGKPSASCVSAGRSGCRATSRSSPSGISVRRDA